MTLAMTIPMRFTMSALILLTAAGCDDDDWDWHNGDPELVVRNTGGYGVRVEVDDLDEDVFYVNPGETRAHDLSSYTFEVRITRTADGLLLLDGDFDAGDFDDDKVEITVTP